MADQYELKRLNELPIFNGRPGDNVTVPAVLDNVSTVRIPWTSFTAGQVKFEGTVPAGYTTDGEEGTLAADSSGIYIYTGGLWRKAPVYTSNWDELTVDTRALLVNTTQDLTSAEIDNVLVSLKLTTATEEKAGLVRELPDDLPDDVQAASAAKVYITDNGGMYVKGATTDTPGVVRYAERSTDANGVPSVSLVNEMIGAIAGYTLPPATTNSLGGIFFKSTTGVNLGDDGSFSLREANDNSPGIVTLATAVEVSNQGVVTSELFYNYMDSLNNSYYQPATYTQPGSVQPKQQGEWTGANATSKLGPMIVENGILDVYPADESRPGVVLIVSGSLPDAQTYVEYESVPTVQAVIDYVRDFFVGIANSLPFATTTTKGVVIVGNGLQMNAETGKLSLDAVSPDWGTIDGSAERKAASAYSTASYIASLQSQIDALTARITALESSQQT